MSDGARIWLWLIGFTVALALPLVVNLTHWWTRF